MATELQLPARNRTRIREQRTRIANVPALLKLPADRLTKASRHSSKKHAHSKWWVVPGVRRRDITYLGEPAWQTVSPPLVPAQS